MEEKIKLINTIDMEVQGDSVEYNDKEYTIEDCILVRTTDIFPFGGIIQTPINGKAYNYGNSNYFDDIIYDKIKAKYPNREFDMSENEKFSRELDEYKLCFENLRSTIHFCLNGLVGSHAYGNFENRPYVIFDPLKYHLDDSLKCLRTEDVYFNNDMKLSSEACILIDYDTFQKISNNLEYLEILKNLKIYIYKGNQQVAVSKVLEDLGYDSFLVGSNGYVNGLDTGKAASKMWKFVNNFAIENNISLDRHFYSDIKAYDDQKTYERCFEIDKAHLIYILDNSNVSKELKEKITLLLDENLNMYIKPLIEQLVDEIGMDQIKNLTQSFNEQYIQELQNTREQNKK